MEKLGKRARNDGANEQEFLCISRKVCPDFKGCVSEQDGKLAVIHMQ
jgi:hypothetical protein